MVRLVELLREEPDCPRTRLVFMVAVSGLAGGALLPTVTRAAERIAIHQPDPRLLFVALILAALTVYARHDFLVQSARTMERILLKLRIRIGQRLRHAPLNRAEEIGPNTLLAVLFRDPQPLRQSALALVLAARSALLILACLAYLGGISPYSLLAALAFIGAYAFIQIAFIHPQRVLQDAESRAAEWRFLRQAQTLVAGLKEIELNRRKNDALFEQYTLAAEANRAAQQCAESAVARETTVGHAASCSFLIMLALVLSGLDDGLDGQVVRLTVAALFIAPELGAWSRWIPEIARADATLEEWYRLERALPTATAVRSAARSPQPRRDFDSLHLEGMEFQFRNGSDSFSLGPIELDLRRGELLFVTGDTGSGKTTLLKLLAGLYSPRSGTIRIDGTPLGAADHAGYREMCAAVFSDFFLFDRLYGLADMDSARVGDWLKRLGLAEKTAFAEGGFTRRNLSSGQRWRLAFIAAVLDEKPILLLDDFAQDQDPFFRDRFYREILPDLKRRGTTVVAVVRDERYFGLADRVVTIADGKLV